jgi:hypothetical protein
MLTSKRRRPRIRFFRPSEASMNLNRDAPSRGPNIAYVGGWSRSGGTVLSALLSTIPGVIAPGEIWHLWAGGLRDNELCNCRKRFRDCPFWDEVGYHAFGGWDMVDYRTVLQLHNRVSRMRNLAGLRFGFLPGRHNNDLVKYRGILGRLYPAIARTGRAQMVVDSSRDAPYACVLHGAPGLSVSVVHLVRDSRGVAFSMQKTVQRPERTADAVAMPTLSAGGTSFRWSVVNIALELLAASGVATVRVRYEDFVENPRRETRRVLEHVGAVEWPGELPVDVPELPAHSIGGNPLRFRGRTVRLQIDNAWLHDMRSRDRIRVTAATLPLLIRYGYGVRPAAGGS